MRLTSRGRLGINTTTPAELLDVNGNIKCSGNLGVGMAATNGINVAVDKYVRIEGGTGKALSIGGTLGVC